MHRSIVRNLVSAIISVLQHFSFTEKKPFFTLKVQKTAKNCFGIKIFCTAATIWIRGIQIFSFSTGLSKLRPNSNFPHSPTFGETLKGHNLKTFCPFELKFFVEMYLDKLYPSLQKMHFCSFEPINPPNKLF
jgi:hypothetical protein